MLQELGIECIGQLAALPRAALRGRFGVEVLERLDQLLATAAEVAVVQKPVERLSAGRLFEYPTNRQELLEAVLAELLQSLTAALAGQRHGILRLACRLVRTDGPPLQFELGLYRPSGCVRHLLDLLRLRLEALRFQASRRSQVEAVQLSVTAAAPLVVEQQELFDRDNPREAPRALAGLVDRLASRLGRQAVVRPTLLADVQPEYACQYLPSQFSPTKTRLEQRRGRAKPPAAVAPAGERPLRLLAAPLPLDATSIVPDGPPLRFRFQGQEQQIVKTWGPERIETGWWRSSGAGIRRDYYRVETSRGSRFWLFRRLSDGRWFLHGEFA
jgi:protein ImuB